MGGIKNGNILCFQNKYRPPLIWLCIRQVYLGQMQSLRKKGVYLKKIYCCGSVFKQILLYGVVEQWILPIAGFFLAPVQIFLLLLILIMCFALAVCVVLLGFEFTETLCVDTATCIQNTSWPCDCKHIYTKYSSVPFCAKTSIIWLLLDACD